jgi:uncharacterized repeat protein (TIGR01451 family)
MKFVGYDSSRGKYDGDIWNVGKLNAGGVEYLNITCIANASGTTVNDALASAFEYDWDESNNYDDAEVNILPVADLAIEKFTDNPNPKYGDLITWTLKVTNMGPNDAANIIVTDALPDGVKFIKSSDDENYDGITWHVGGLKSGQSRELAVQCRVTSTGSIKNIANVVGDYHDPNMDNNRAESAISVAPASDLAITKLATKYNYAVGDVIEYVIEVVNNGPDTAHNIRVSEILDDLLKLKSFKPSMGKFDKFTNVWTIESLGYGESARLYIKAVATGTGTLENQVSLTSDTFDYDMSNNNDFAIVKVVKKDSNKKSDSSGNGKSGSSGNGKSGNSNNGNAGNDGSGLSNLQKHSTANPVAGLLIALSFCAVVFRKQNFQRKD